MAPTDWEARAVRFVKRVALKLCNDLDADAEAAFASLLLPSSDLEPLLRESVVALPHNALRSALQKDFERFVVLLRDEIRAARPDLGAQSFEAAEQHKGGKTESVIDPLSVARGSLLTDAEYARATEAVISAAEGGVSSATEAQEWRLVSERLLQARTNPPLPLFWAYLVLDMAAECKSSISGEELNKILITQGLWQRLKTVSSGLTDAATAVAAIAPVVALLFNFASGINAHAGLVTDMKSSEGKALSGKDIRRFLKRLKCVVGEILTFVAVCRQRKDSLGQGLLVSSTSNKLNKGLSIALERNSDLLRDAILKYTSKDNIEKLTAAEALPLIRDDQRKRWRKREQVEFLADVVSIEIFFLQLLTLNLEFRFGSKNKSNNSDNDFQKKLKLVAIHAAASTASLSSYETLLDILMEPSLPFHTVLNGEEEIILKEAIYEAVLFMEPVHLRWLIDESSLAFREDPERAGVVFLKRLAVCRQAMSFFRLQNQFARADNLLTTVAPPYAPSHLVRWLNSVDLKQKLRTDLKDSHAVTGWLLKSTDEAAFEEVLRMYTNIRRHKETDKLKGKKDFLSEDKVCPPIQQTTEKLENSMYYFDTQGDTISVRENEEAEFAAVDEALVGAAKKLRDSDNKNLKKKARILFHRHQQSIGSKRHRDGTSDEASDETT
ncbi:hypothetical protein O6H91_13G066000 [Diphasiastrum complanatum]|uniref:Uncharacterized protein n=1 Tax=Diphasiastrum complanatum TaxID=34168 RepID=A0ACC2BVN5_DIPCM|nr:hypothetical protein O6H91_Y408600 [Diphasiastrum complanatum]KAJ7533811.1 hypothetical protein O6H91_13G066000 [Diphasiastrum complanatum]